MISDSIPTIRIFNRIRWSYCVVQIPTPLCIAEDVSKEIQFYMDRIRYSGEIAWIKLSSSWLRSIYGAVRGAIYSKVISVSTFLGVTPQS